MVELMNFKLFNKCCDVVYSSRTSKQIDSARRYLLLAIRSCRNDCDKVTAEQISEIHYDWKPGKIMEGIIL